jgi:hypothetical protein
VGSLAIQFRNESPSVETLRNARVETGKPLDAVDPVIYA